MGTDYKWLCKEFTVWMFFIDLYSPVLVAVPVSVVSDDDEVSPNSTIVNIFIITMISARSCNH